MATFFGEVNEISSRAVWWSDSESEEENAAAAALEEDGDFKHFEKVKPEVSYKMEILDDQRWTTFRENCKLLYVSLGKKSPQSLAGSCIARVKVDAIIGGEKKNISGSIASLFFLKDGDYWLVVDYKLTSVELVNFCPRLVNYLAEQIFSQAKTVFDLMIISKELTRWEYVQYITGSSASTMKDRLTQLTKVVDLRPLLPPETVKSELELALLEYCIVSSNKKFNFACLLLPSEYAETLDFLPKPIISSITEFTLFSHLNIV